MNAEDDTPVIIRVQCHVNKTDGVHTADLSLPLTHTFQDYIGVLCQVYDNNFTEFLYEDEEDYITVSNETDFQNMIYWWRLQGSAEVPLVIHALPDAGDTSGLFVEVPAHEDIVPNSHTGSPLTQAIESQSVEINPSEIHIMECIGKGASAFVHRAVHEPSETVIAVKRIRLEESTPQLQNQILVELGILHKCKSQFIIKYFGAYFHDDHINFCMEYMNAGSIDRYKPISEPVLAVITLNVLRGLQYLSLIKIMHRDVKPSNILVNTAGEIKLCDFSVSRVLEESVTVSFVGTNAYMAPERIQHLPYDERSETWSVGLSLFELAIGYFPYDSENQSLAAFELIQAVVHELPPQLPATFSSDFQHFIECSLTKDPSRRPTARQLLQHQWITTIHDGHQSNFQEWLEIVAEVVAEKS
eukprot:m.58337 g.58337  ORF g.58337 m.58337 type:complete len:415 (+) comp7859_c0_seq5:41-1285(+)